MPFFRDGISVKPDVIGVGRRGGVPWLSDAARSHFGLTAGLALAALVWVGAYLALHPVADVLTYDLLRLSRDSHLGSAVNFFLYDTPKILLLLTAVVFLVGIVRTFFTAERARRALGGRREGIGNGAGGGLGGG